MAGRNKKININKAIRKKDMRTPRAVRGTDIPVLEIRAPHAMDTQGLKKKKPASKKRGKPFLKTSKSRK